MAEKNLNAAEFRKTLANPVERAADRLLDVIKVVEAAGERYRAEVGDTGDWTVEAEEPENVLMGIHDHLRTLADNYFSEKFEEARQPAEAEAK